MGHVLRRSTVGSIVALPLLASFWAGHAVGGAQNLSEIASTPRPAFGEGAPASGSAPRDVTSREAVIRPRRLVSANAVATPRVPLTEADGIGSFQGMDHGPSAPLDPPGASPVISFSLPDRTSAIPASSDALDAWSRLLNDIAPLRAQGERMEVQPERSATDEQPGEPNLAKQLANPSNIIPVPGVPISSYPVVPFESNFNFRVGPAQRGFQYMLTIQPVIPFSINGTWNFITRPIIPVIYQNKVVPGTGDQLGLGDTTFQFFFSPRAPTKERIFWGVGPTVLAPTGTEPLLSARTWGAGINGVVLTQLPQGGGLFTAGVLASQTWSFAGPATINTLFLQPFVDFTFPDTLTICLWSQSTYAWNQRQWTVPIILTVGKLFRFGDQLVAINLGPKYYPVGPLGAPAWGIRTTATLLFPNPD